MFRNMKGYTLLELVAGISIILGGFILLFPQITVGMDDSRESETKSNLHLIQIAIERYMADNGEYPRFLLGGDVAGWAVWHDRWDGVNDKEMRNGDGVASNDILHDILIQNGYLYGYPCNPFLDDGSIVISATNLSGSTESGDGDPRFGFHGNVMGQCLDDPNYFKGAINQGNAIWSEYETRRTLDHGDWMKVPPAFIDPSTNMYYMFGGRRNNVCGVGGMTFVYWPGEFFYKAAPDFMFVGRNGWSSTPPNNKPGGIRTRYVLGAYGADVTSGMDVIRLLWSSSDGSPVAWRSGPPYDMDSFYCGYEDGNSFGNSCGLPEVFGGGDDYIGPWVNYCDGGVPGGEFIYGAPDGVNDGVIIVLTDYYWQETGGENDEIM